MAEYPREFSAEAKARVEVEKIEAWKYAEERSKSLRRDQYEEPISELIIRVSRAFADEVCKLGMMGEWDVDQVRSQAEQFPYRFAEDFSNDPHKTLGGFPLSVLTQGGPLARILERVEQSADWRTWLDEKLLAVAKVQSGVSKASRNQKEPVQVRKTDGKIRSRYKLAIRQGLVHFGLSATAQEVATWIAEKFDNIEFSHIKSKYGERSDLGQLYRNNPKFRAQFDRDVTDERKALKSIAV